MAIRINLLPKSYQPPKPLGGRELVVAAAVGLTIFGGGAYYISAWTGLGKLEQETTVKSAQLQQVKMKLADAASIKQREQKVTSAEGSLKSLTGRDWSPFLENLTEMTPQHLTWTALKAEKDLVNLTGNALGLIDLAQFFGGLVNHPAVDYVVLHYVNEQGIPITMTIKDKNGTVNMAGLSGMGAPTVADGKTTSPSASAGAANGSLSVQAGADGSTTTGAGAPAVLGQFRRIEFEVSIELKPLKGGAQDGA